MTTAGQPIARRVPLPFSWFAFICTCLQCFALGAQERHEPDVGKYADALKAYVAPQAQQALHLIEGTPRRLLALRSYLRAGEKLENRWSWSAEQIEAYGSSREYRRLVAEVERIRERFEAANPGYTLYANTQVRSLDTQLERWNHSRLVGKVAESLQRAVQTELKKLGYPAEPNHEALEHLVNFLQSWRPPTLPPLAAPGLSLHGQLRAIDFQVMRGKQIVARADISAVQTAWEAGGWSEKLKAAVDGSRFVGPLKAPHEPWHYEYNARASIRTASVAAGVGTGSASGSP